MGIWGSHGEVRGGLALGDGVEDDGGEVGDEVRRLAAQRRQVPHPPPIPGARTPLNSGAARRAAGVRSSAASGAPAADPAGNRSGGDWGRRSRRCCEP
jgi:hypothetical protein